MISDSTLDSQAVAFRREMRLEDGSYHRQNEFTALSTGLPNLDKLLLGGGFPIGSVSEIFGEAGSGKTNLALLAASAAVSSGHTIAFFDLEGTLSSAYLSRFKLDTPHFVVFRPETTEDVLSITLSLLRSEAIDFFIYDSTAALCSNEERAHTLTDPSIVSPLNESYRLVCGVYNLLRDRPAAALFISQLRWYKDSFGMAEQSTGGAFLQRLSAVRLFASFLPSREPSDEVILRIEKGGCNELPQTLTLFLCELSAKTKTP